MKAISLWQPWATLLAAGRKRVETRSWQTNYRGPLLVHASKHWDGDCSSLCVREPFKNALESLGVFHPNPFVKPTGLPFGAIIGRVEVVGCYPTEKVAFADSDESAVIPWDGGIQIPETDRFFGDYSPDRFAWVCQNAVLFPKPIPYRGAMQLFDVKDELVVEAVK